MAWFVYILRSEMDGDYYKGITENVHRRLEEHNSGQSEFTSTKMPWQLVYYKEMADKRAAIIEEKRLKRLNRKSLEKLIHQENAALVLLIIFSLSLCVINSLPHLSL